MAIIYGATLVQTNKNESDLRSDVIGQNSQAFSANDVVTGDGGVLDIVDSATDAIIGVVVKAATMSSSNQTVAFVRPSFIPADAESVWLMGTNSDLTNDATDYGKFFGITGATGAMLVNVSGGVTTTTSRQVMIVKIDPFGIGGSGSGSGLRQVLVKFFRTPSLNF